MPFSTFYETIKIAFSAILEIEVPNITKCKILRKMLHSHIWQRLPRSFRRTALFQAMSLIAPRPEVKVKATEPILVVGALRTASGLGESARLCHDALKSEGLTVYGIDLTASLMQAEDAPDFSFTDGRTHRGKGTLIIHVNAPFMPQVMLYLGRRLVRGKKIIGYWAWELSKVPHEWQFGIPFVHDIWVPSTFTAKAVRSIAENRPVHVVPHPVALRKSVTIPELRSVERPFTVLTFFNAASSFSRKNPMAVIDAFRKAFGTDASAQLIIKASNLSKFPTGMELIVDAIQEVDNIVLINKTISICEIHKLYNESDVVISLHRSEGFGLTIAEAMLHALPVIVTDWSGNIDFLNAKMGIPIPYNLVPAKDTQGTYHYPNMLWADANIQAAAQALKKLRDDKDYAKRLGQAAAYFGKQAWSTERYTKTVRGYLGLTRHREANPDFS